MPGRRRPTRNPIRHGTVSPGYGIPVKAPSELYQAKPDIVVALADDRPRLSNMRHDLRPMMEGSAFCDGPRFAASLEAAYRGMWNAYCARRATTEG